MSDEQPDKENEVTPEGAVEVNEEDLDQAAGGGSDIFPKIVFDTSTQRVDLKQATIAPLKDPLQKF